MTGTYKDYTIISAPPPSSGGIVLIEALNILEGYNLSRWKDRTPDEMHLIVEAYRRAYMDRTDYLGDPDYVKIPVDQLIDKKYAAAWRTSIVAEQATPSKDLKRPAGFIPPPPTMNDVRHESTQTTHYSVVDADGNAVAVTTTLNNGFGSGCHGHRPRLPAQRRDGRLRVEARRSQHVRTHPGSSQHHRSRQAPALRHDADHRAQG